jgi:spermidine synthase
LLYAANTLGAVAGCLAAGFYLLRLHDVGFATYAAAAINIALALASYALAAIAPVEARDAAMETKAAPNSEALWPVTLAIAISGATALGAEIVWTRQFAMLFDGTVYAFSIILAVFLAGLALGSGAGAVALRFVPARAALGWCLLLVAGGIAWAAYMINMVLPFQAVDFKAGGWGIAAEDLLRTVKAIAPATLLWGAAFPLAMAAAHDGGDPAKSVGRVYAANTLGGVAGALLASLVLVSTIGSQNTQRVMLMLAALGGFFLVARHILTGSRGIAMAAQAAVLAALLMGAGYLMGRLPAQPGDMVAYGRQLLTFARYSKLLEVQEGRNSSMAITRYSDNSLQISVAGHVEASNISYDMRLQRMIGHLPALLHPHPAKILGIGFGAGVSAGSFTVHPDVQSITVCELEPKVPPTSSKYFAPYDNNVLHDPRTHIVYDDGRHFLRTTTETFDIIASDPLDVWVKGTAGIYSADYFEEVKRHLNPGGYFTLYVPLYESDEATVKSEIATFFQAFPGGTIWANTADGQGYDLVLMGQVGPTTIDIDAAEARLARPDHARVLASMRQIGFGSATDMYATYIGQQSDLAPWLKGAEINTDRNLRLMYLAGWGINSQIEDPLYRTLLSYRHKPANIFHGSPEGLGLLYQEMAGQRL